MVHSHVHIETRAEALRCLERERGRIGNGAADIVGQTAIRIGNIARAFEHDDLRVFVQPSETCCCRRATRYSTNDDHFHALPSFCVCFLSLWLRLYSMQKRRSKRNARRFLLLLATRRWDIVAHTPAYLNAR